MKEGCHCSFFRNGIKLVLLVCSSVVLLFGCTSIIPIRDSLLFVRENKTYLISDELDLKGDTIIIPQGCALKFTKGGSVKNGVLIGSETSIQAKKKYHNLFNNVTLHGDWMVNSIYDYWFCSNEGVGDIQKIKNLFALCSDSVINDVYISDGIIHIDLSQINDNTTTVFSIPSNTHIHNRAIIKAHSGVQNRFFLFSYNDVTNCTWEGGTIEGDIYTHNGDSGEHGYGIALRGVNNIVIKDVTCKDCWGDGINLQYAGNGKHNNNVVVDNVICDGNRRQGISICDGIGVKIINSRFINTGQYRGTAPGFGIDIEPSYEDAIVSNISIEDCIFDNNAGGGVCCSFIKETDCDISIINCSDYGGGLRLNSCLVSNLNKGINISGYNCPNGKLRFKRKVQNVQLNNCSFMSAFNQSADKDILKNISFFKVDLKSAEQRTWNFFCLSLLCAETENVIFDSCSFEVLKESTLTAVLPYSGDWSGVSMTDCEIIENRDNPFYIPCDVVNSSLKSQTPIVFVNQKTEGALNFYRNTIVINKPVQKSPFVFMTSSNRDYEFLNNTIYYSGYIDEEDLIVKHKRNSQSPSVRLQGNVFRSLD